MPTHATSDEQQFSGGFDKKSRNAAHRLRSNLDAIDKFVPNIRLQL